MTKKLINISNATGKQLEDAIEITIERPGYLIVLPDGGKTNMAILHVEPDFETLEISKLKFEKMEGDLTATVEEAKKMLAEGKPVLIAANNMPLSGRLG